MEHFTKPDEAGVPLRTVRAFHMARTFGVGTISVHGRVREGFKQMMLIRFLLSIPFVIIGESLRNLGMWIAPVQTIANGGVYRSDVGGFFVNGFGESPRLCENVDIAQSVLTFRTNREIERYRTAVEEADQVLADKRGEAKPSCP